MRILVFLLLFSSFQLNAQIDLESKLDVEQTKPTIVFVHADWCKYCERMMSEIFENEGVVNELTKNYKILLFDSESEEPFEFNNEMYYYNPTGIGTGSHEFALQFSTNEQGNVSFPTICLVSPDGEVIERIHGYISASELRDKLNNQVL